MNYIPDGFKNNLAWHLGHIVVTQQLLNYKLSGLPLKVDNVYVEKYRKGTGPEGHIDAEEIDFLKGSAMSLIEELQEDLKKGLFENFQRYETSYGVTIENIEEALQFVIMHDALHLGLPDVHAKTYSVTLEEKILNIPIGYSEVYFSGKRYSLTRSDFNDGKSLKIFAEELGGSDFISFNYYVTQNQSYIKPCEMPKEKVVAFVERMEYVTYYE